MKVVGDQGGLRLQVDGRDFLVYGMNWDYVPIGQNYAYSLWTQPDDVIEAALEREMPLLKTMGVNALRLYVGIPAKWVTYIYRRWGIYSVLNHTVGRYGITLDGLWIPAVDYSDPKLRAVLKKEVLAVIDEYRDVPGVLMWLLGNENNYGLSWASFEIENLPQGERDAARAKFLYSLYGELIHDIKAKDMNHPVSIANGDLQYIDLIAQECKGLDVLGTNVYRGKSARDLFQQVHDKLGIPVMFTEFGADAYDSKQMREDDVVQAKYLLAQWKEIYQQSAGKGKAGNAIGGFIFQWSDGWWKFNQEKNLDLHDTNASWANAGYAEDYVPGENNMNEEWWGICAKGQPDSRGLFQEYPRTAYYVLQEAFKLPAYEKGSTLAAIDAWFDKIDPVTFAGRYRSDTSVLALAQLGQARVAGLRVSFETIGNGGARITTLPASRTVDHMESLYADFEAKPTDRVLASLSLNVLGNVATNPIDQIFYENRGWPVRVACAPQAGDPVTCGQTPTSQGSTPLQGLERIKIYKAAVSWDDPAFHLEAFFRTGHYHWGYEGDFFGLYREANYGLQTDIYNADAPAGIEVAFKKQLAGLKIAFGPQLWWGANPAVMAKYQWSVGKVELAFIHEEQLSAQGSVGTSAVVPEQKTRKSTLSAATHFGPAKLELGGIAAGYGLGCSSGEWCGSTRVNRVFLRAGADQATPDHVRGADTLGAKAKLTVESGMIHWYAQGAYMGLVADAGPQQTITFTGWYLKDSGSGNQVNALTGLAVNLGVFQLAPNVLWQKPLVGPGPGVFGAPLRSILTDPFAVRANRELLAAELMFIYDPTPGTWMWAWDNDLREDAHFAASVDFLVRHQPTSEDAAIGVLGDGTRFAFPGAPPARDLWEVNARVVSAPLGDLRLVSHLYVGLGEPNGDSQRVVHRYGGDARATFHELVVSGFARFNDWGPYDFHRDFNLTFPVQLMGDVGYTLGSPRWLGLNQTRIGVRGTLRYLNGYSPRFLPDAQDATSWGREYELRTYLLVSL